MRPVEPLLFPTEVPVNIPASPSPLQKILCVALPTWPTDRVRRRRGDLRHRPLAIVDTVGNRRTVVSACATARAVGVCAGMSLTEANLRCPGIAHAPYQPTRDATALMALARWMALRFTPIVAIEPPDALFLEIGGCERLFGGIDAIVRQVRDATRRFQITATLAVASTPGAAWAFARYSNRDSNPQSELSNSEFEVPNSSPQATPAARAKSDMRIDKGECGLLKSPRYLSVNSRPLSVYEKAGVRPGGTKISNSACELSNLKSEMSRALAKIISQRKSEPESEPEASLADLPPAALRIAPDIAQTLARLGVVTIRQLVGLPRDALPSRFGAQLLLRIDQALGRVPEPLVPVQCRAAIVVSREWDGPVEAQEALASVLDELLDEAILALARRGQGARRIDVHFRCPYAPPIRKTIALGRPSREAKNLRRLMRCLLESLEADEGFNAITLRVVTAEPIAAAKQVSLVDVENESAAGEVEKLMDRLKIRMGDTALERALLVESHQPERAVRYAAAEEVTTKPRAEIKTPKRAKRIELQTHDAKFGSLAPRPLELLTVPALIGVTVTPTNDREGKPIAFSHEGQVHRLQTVIGPERVAGVWWTGHNKTRDYFDVIDEEGKRFWVFRVLETWKWYLHGVF